MLKSTAVANEALQSQAAAMQRELVAAQEAAAAAAGHQQRAAAAEKAAAEAAKAASDAQALAAALEERLQVVEEEMDRVTGAVGKSKEQMALIRLICSVLMTHIIQEIVLQQILGMRMAGIYRCRIVEML